MVMASGRMELVQAEVPEMLKAAGFVDVEVKVKKESRDLIKKWMPGPRPVLAANLGSPN